LLVPPVPMSVGGELKKFSLPSLFLDEENPRLPARLQGATQHELLEFMVDRYNAIEVARSISRHGYFNSEPLIAIHRARRSGRDRWTVVEGNRRLAALKCLADEDLRSDLRDGKIWSRLAAQAKLPRTYPVIVAKNRAEVWPIVGFRHISGIEPWRPLQKARFIFDMAQASRDFGLVGAEIGETETSVRSHYRNYCIYQQAADDFGIEVDNLEDNFGTFTRAMTSIPIRAYIGAPNPREVEIDKQPIPASKESDLRNLLSWLFGLPGEGAVLPESRFLSDLAAVLEDKRATANLRRFRDLGRAAALTGAPLDRLKKALDNAERHLEAAAEDLPRYSEDAVVQRRVRRILSLAKKLGTATK
jgi:hypothetical protein